MRKPYGNINSIQNDKGPFTGRTALNATTATPITAIGDVSGSGTTFTATTVTDGAAWDLSAIEAGMVAKTSGGWLGLITAVNDGTGTLTVHHWEYRGTLGDPRAAAIPAAGETVQIHRVHKCCRLILFNATGILYFAKNATPTAINGAMVRQSTANQDHELLLMPEMAGGDGLDRLVWYIRQREYHGLLRGIVRG